jgi:hypothetical protein
VKETEYNKGHKEALDRILGEIAGVKPGKMFGFPAYYVGGKLFACVYGDGVGVKVPESVAKQLLQEGRAVPFQPMGRPKMKEWVQLNRSGSKDYTKDADVFAASVEYVSSLSKQHDR